MDIQSLEHWSFGMTEKEANYLLSLVLEGKKTATASSYLGYQVEGEEIPKAGEMSVITYWDETPACVIKTTSVRIIPYNEITFDIAKLEGEDDCLESWQNHHSKFFTEEGKEVGYTFTEDMPVVFEEFDVIKVL